MRPVRLFALTLAASIACVGVLPSRPDARLEAWKRQAAELRGLAFESEVELVWVEPEALPAVIRAEYAGQFSAETERRYRDGYAALGVFPRDLDLIATMIELQAESIAGLYSPRSRTLYVIAALRDPASKTDFNQSSIVVHELVHALQQQHFPATIELLAGLRRQDDVVGALSAAVEGDATFTMLGVREATAGAGGRDQATAERMRELILAEGARADGPLVHAPPLLRDSILFPYAHGTPASARIFAAGGIPGLDAALRDPPLSTLQLLEPDECDPVEFVRLPVAELAAGLAPRACAAGIDNVAGALTLEVLFGQYAPELDVRALRKGWSGDRFLQIDCGESWELVWLTRWDSPEAGARFAAAYRAIAAAVAANSPLSGAPEVVLRERTALVVTPGLRARADWILAESEIRSYTRFSDWRADDCFPESPCPVAAPPGWLFSRPHAPVAQLDRAADF